MKKCSKCKIDKDESFFNKRLDGLNSRCRECSIIASTVHRRTKNGLVSKVYSHQIDSSKKRNHHMPTYTKYELIEWALKQEKFHELHKEWVRCDYLKELTPSVDRKDDSKGYSFDNIQLMTWMENQSKAYADTRSGKLTHGSKPQKSVLQYNKDGHYIAEYVSGREASRVANIDQAMISGCCTGKYKSAGGFIWKFKTLDEKVSKKMQEEFIKVQK